jgi:hypothetical protein
MDTATDKFFSSYIENFLAGNQAARDLAELLKNSGVGLMPLVDHCTLRTLDVNKRAQEVIDLGFQYDESIGVLEFDTWWAKVYRKPGYPSLFIDQAYSGERGQGNLIPGWVKAHGDQCFHHIAILVENIDFAIAAMKKRNIKFAANIVGEPETDLRQIFTEPEKRNGKVFSVLELIERHNGYIGFLPPQANGLMESTRK